MRYTAGSPDGERRPASPMQAKILIIGGGAMGTSVAYHAAAKCDPLADPVVLLEKGRLGSGSSGRASAVIHQGYPERALAGMARDALKVYAGIKSATGRSVGYQRTGVLEIAAPGVQARAALTASVAMQRSLGIEVRTVDATEMRALCPGIEVPDDAFGAFERQGGYIDGRRTIATLATLARDRGAVTRVGQGEPELIVERGRAVGVRTKEGEFRAPHIVLSVGPWTPRFLAQLGVNWPLRVVRVREQFLTMPPAVAQLDQDALEGDNEMEMRFQPDPLDTLAAAHPVVIDHGLDFIARCEPAAGRTRIGRLSFDADAVLDRPEELGESHDIEFAQSMRASLTQRLPIYADLADQGSRASWITLSPDVRPIAGPVEQLPGLWVVAGFSGNDFQLAPSIGAGITQMILGEPVSAFDVDFLSPKRFG
jgi:sarcosine oxidase subunit beta